MNYAVEMALAGTIKVRRLMTTGPGDEKLLVV
jgi:hypothetical protein